MPARAVGLDVGTHAVRAAELTLARDRVTLTRFGQVALPIGAVRGGEVVDPPAVAAAIRRLWSEAGFRTRSVIVGVANQRLIVREAELPAMSEADLRSALSFEVEELIPIPIEDAILDFQILEQVSGPDQEALMRILLVAAHRDMVRSLLAAVEGAGLSASLVDPIPFALIRSLLSEAPGLDFDSPAEAIVDVGAGVTNVVVHERGVPRFVRILGTGGEDVTDAIATDLGLDADSAEDLKRRADTASADDLEASAGRIVGQRMGPFVEEVRGSVDFYLSQSGADQIARVLLTGGESRLPGMAAALQETLQIPVEPAHPLLGLRIGATGLTEDQLVSNEALLATPIGLALAGRPAEAGVRRMTLLPGEAVAVRERRRQTSLVGAALAVLAALLMLLWLARGSEVNRQRDRADRAETQVRQLQTQAAQLTPVVDLENQVQQRRRLVTAALGDDIAWTRLLQEIATVLPSDVWLTSFKGDKGTASGAPAPAGRGAVGNISVAGMGFDHSSSARWLLRVGDLPSLTGLFLPNSTKQGTGPTALVQFTSTANLTARARGNRAAQYLGGG